ncbi:hypothetical protein Tco_1376371 [Tanacetum coccineum]
MGTSAFQIHHTSLILDLEEDTNVGVLVVLSPASLNVMPLALGIVEGAVVVVLYTGSSITTLDFALFISQRLAKETDIRQKDEKQSQKRQNRARNGRA